MLTIKDLFGNILPVWVVDFETYFDSKLYTLRKMTTTTYVRDPRFRAHGCAVIDPDGFAFWVTHKDLPKFFNSVDWSKAAWNSHNSAFDALIANEHYGVQAAYYIDTMSMSYGEWSIHHSGSLKAVCKRLGLEGKLEGRLAETDGIRELTCEQERRLVPYAIQDVEQGLAVFEALYFDRNYPEQELHIIDQTIKAYVNPILRVDANLCRAEIEEEERRLKALFESDLIQGAELSDTAKSILASDGVQGLLRSRPCFAELLRSRGVEPPLKHAMDTKTKEFKYTTEGIPVMTYAFAKNDVELMALADDSRVSDLVAAWTGAKSTIRKARAEQLLLHSVNGTKPLPVPLKSYGAHTMRWSGWDQINLQNLNSGRDGRGTRLRESLNAPPGYVLCAVDSAQIECRVNAWLWGQKDLLETFRTGGDPYSVLASKMYKIHVSKKENSDKRPVGKATELGLGFGMGLNKFYTECNSGSIISQVVPMTFEEATEAWTYWRNNRQNIVQGWQKLRDIISLMTARAIDKNHPIEIGPMLFYNEQVMMPNKLCLHYRNIHYRKIQKTDKNPFEWECVFQTGKTKIGEKLWTRIYHSKMDENLVQCLARIIMAEQALMIAKKYKLILLVHDEIVYLVPEEEAEEGLAYGLKCMGTPLPWCLDLPLEGEGKFGKNYGQVK